MKHVFELLHKDMLADISRCLELEHQEKENVESCFFIAKNYWERLQAMVKSHAFRDDEAEISFYRDVKPKFASHIEYFSLLAEGLMFVPPWIPFPDHLNGKIEEAVWLRTWQESVSDYWTKEQERGKRFYGRNQEFIEYCENDCSDQDGEYFLARNNAGTHLLQRRTHNRETELFTVHEEILTTWLAYKKYAEYIKAKINEPVGS